MKRMLIVFLFTGMSLTALLFGISCSNQAPNSAFVAPVQTLSANNPAWTNTPTFTITPTPTPTPAFPVAGFNGPFGLAIDSKNNIYVGDTGNNLIKQYVNGFLSATWPTGKTKNGLSYTSPKAIAVDGTGNLYVVGSGNAVSKYDPNGNFIAQYTNTTVISPVGMSGPLGLAVNSGSTTLYVSDSGNQRILAMSLSTGVFSAFESSLSYTPQGLAINGSDLYVAGSGTAPTSIYNYVLSSGSPDSPAAIPGFNSPYDIAFDNNNNNLYVSDTNNGRIDKFTAGNFTISPSFIGVGTLSRPEGIVTDSLGNVYVVDSGNSELFQFP